MSITGGDCKGTQHHQIFEVVQLRQSCFVFCLVFFRENLVSCWMDFEAVKRDQPKE